MTVPAQAPGPRHGCGLCKHPKALHSGGRTDCKAFACTAGPDGAPCPGYLTVAEAQAYLRDGTLPARVSALAAAP